MLLLLDLALAQFGVPPAADGSATTFDECKAACASHAECCNDDLNQGSDQKLSCLMCCTIRTRGTSEAECLTDCLLYTSPSPRDLSTSRMPSSA